MTTDLERDSASDDRIRKWLARTLEADPIDRLIIRHDTGAEVATIRGVEGGPFESGDSHLDELASGVSERVFEDAIGLGGVQRYIIIAYALDKVIARLTLRENADASGANRLPGDPIDSEPPTERGLLTQTMRHLEISERTHATVVANIFAMQSRMLREKDERIAHLEERHWETVIAAELFTSDQQGARPTEFFCRYLRVQRSADGPTPVLAFGCEGILELPSGPTEISIADDSQAASSSLTDEEVLRQYHVPLALLSPASLRVTLAGESRGPAAARNVTYRVRSGGTPDHPDGTTLLTIQDVGPSDAVISADASPFARPIDASTLIKVTGQGDTAVPAVIRNFVLLFHSA